MTLFIVINGSQNTASLISFALPFSTPNLSAAKKRLFSETSEDSEENFGPAATTKKRKTSTDNTPAAAAESVPVTSSEGTAGNKSGYAATEAAKMRETLTTFLATINALAKTCENVRGKNSEDEQQPAESDEKRVSDA